MSTAKELIDNLGLEAHPEGGYFKETYRSLQTMMAASQQDTRHVSTGIYYLLDGQDFSAFHRIQSDEMWHFYDGGGLHIHVIHPNGKYELLDLGLDVDQGQLPQQVVPAGAWFAAENIDKSKFTLAGCTVAPGFDFRDFELANAVDLVSILPAHVDLINRLTITS